MSTQQAKSRKPPGTQAYHDSYPKAGPKQTNTKASHKRHTLNPQEPQITPKPRTLHPLNPARITQTPTHIKNTPKQRCRSTPKHSTLWPHKIPLQQAFNQNQLCDTTALRIRSAPTRQAHTQTTKNHPTSPTDSFKYPSNALNPSSHSPAHTLAPPWLPTMKTPRCTLTRPLQQRPPGQKQSRIKQTRKSGTASKSNLRLKAGSEISRRRESAGRDCPSNRRRTKEGESEEGARSANGAGDQGGNIAATPLCSDGAGSNRDLARKGTGTRTNNGNRRRALIEDYSDEDEAAKDDLHTIQTSLMKGKALTFQDVDIDMQLENVSPEHGGSSLQLSLSNDEFMAALNQAAIL